MRSELGGLLFELSTSWAAARLGIVHYENKLPANAESAKSNPRGRERLPQPKLGPLTYTDTNYTLDGAQLISGTLTITPAPLTITANNQSPLNPNNTGYGYGFDDAHPGTSAALGTTDYTITSGTLITNNGDKLSSVTLSTNDTLSSSSHYNAGTWTITPSAASGIGLSNYNITYANASIGLTVTPQPLTINYGQGRSLYPKGLRRRWPYRKPLRPFGYRLLNEAASRWADCLPPMEIGRRDRLPVDPRGMVSGGSGSASLS